MGRNDRIAIPEFAAVIHFPRQTGQALNEVFTRETGVPTGAASHDLDLLHFPELLLGDINFIEEDSSTLKTNTAYHRVLDGPGLLKNLFEHEMLVAALFSHHGIPKNPGDLTAHNLAIKVGQTHTVGS